MAMKRIKKLSVLCLAIWVYGCSKQSAPPTVVNKPGGVELAEPSVDSSASSDAAAEGERPRTEGEVTVEVKDLDGIRELIASKRGKVVVMDCWSTWCEPCVKEFPGLVKLHEKYNPDDLACVSLSFNYGGGKNETPEDYKEEVLEFLQAKRATFDNVIASVPSEELYKPLGFKTGAVPAIFVYDRDGQIARQFEGADAKYSDVDKLVAELLEQPSEEKP